MTPHFLERAVRVELLYREVNERIRSVGTRLFGIGEDEELAVICECLRLGCAARISLPAGAYAEVRDDPNRFVVVRGHEDLEVERVVAEFPTCLVVEKDPGDVERLAGDVGKQIPGGEENALP